MAASRDLNSESVDTDYRFWPIDLRFTFGILNGVEAFLYCQLEGAVGDETVILARQQSTDIFFLVR